MSEETADNLITSEKQPALTDRLTHWLQFPRRLVFLLIAYGLARYLIIALRGLLPIPPGMSQEIDWTMSLRMRLPVADLILERLPNTTRLIISAMFAALVLALIYTVIAVLVNRLEAKTGVFGSILKWVGKLLIFGASTAPVFVLGFYLIYVYAIQKGLLPSGGMYDLGVDPGDRSGLLRHLALPVTTLALFPALLTAQTMITELTKTPENKDFRFWLGGIINGMGTLLGQFGGMLSALLLVEVVFAWPGIGRLAYDGAINQDFPVLLGVLNTMVGLVLAGRLGAEFLHWLARLFGESSFSAPPATTPWLKRACIIWIIAGMLLLLLPFRYALPGITASQEEILTTDIKDRFAPPSPEHPWGTDDLGRDLQARAVRSTLVALETSGRLAAITIIPCWFMGALAGYLVSRKQLWSESVADLLLLPADVMLLIPLIPAALVLILASPSKDLGPITSVWVFTIVLLPRAVRLMQKLWTAAPQQRRWLTIALPGTVSLFLGVMFAGFWLITSIDFLGFGVSPPEPSLGGMISTGISVQPSQFLPIIGIVWLCSFALYTAADSLVGMFDSKEVLGKLNQ